MKCPICGEPDTKVVDSRGAKEDTEIRRRRLCESCSHRFTTYEKAQQSLPVVIKKDGRRELWNQEKILGGLGKACEKRPISIKEIEQLSDAVVKDVNRIGDVEVSSQVIGQQIMTRLHELDEVAYVRFASVYRSFKDVDEFMNDLADLIKDREKPYRQAPK